MTAPITATLGTLPFETDHPDGYVLTIGENGLKGWFNGAPVLRPGTRRLWTHGRFPERGYRDARIITVEGLIQANTEAAAKKAYQALTGVIADGTSTTFTVVDPIIGTQYAEVFLAAEETPKIEWITDLTASYLLQLEAPDPLKYGPDITGFTLPAEPGGGLGLDLFTQNTLGILDFGAVGQAGTVTLYNEGTALAYPVFTLTGPFTDFDIIETSSGYRLTYDGTIADGSTLVLNSKDGTCVADTTGDRSTNLTSRQWTALGPGETLTYYFEPGTYSTGAGMTVTAAPAWF